LWYAFDLRIRLVLVVSEVNDAMVCSETVQHWQENHQFLVYLENLKVLKVMRVSDLLNAVVMLMGLDVDWIDHVVVLTLDTND
jgi:hypothetical protein